jgi:hypothetical protein
MNFIYWTIWRQYKVGGLADDVWNHYIVMRPMLARPPFS